MARAINNSKPEGRAAYEPLYDIDPHTGAIIEVSYCDQVLAKSFDTNVGWLWWTCQRGCLPQTPPHGPFATGYGAYRDALGNGGNSTPFGKRERNRHVGQNQ